jgi:glycosyltransferase involved in cell wall biosynthesis
MSTVSLCMIVKNEISNISALIAQVGNVFEEIIIVDTGSTDGTREKLTELQKEVEALSVYDFEWVDDFGKARNYSLSKATKNWIAFLDGDDLYDSATELIKFKNNLMEDANVDCWILSYVYSRYPDGSPQTVLARERFFRRSCNPTWIGAIHETVDISRMRTRFYDGLKVIHNREGKKIDFGRNIRILEKEYERQPNDPRTVYYYGKELFDHINPKAEEVLERYLTLNGRYWDDEINARARLAKAKIAKKDHGSAIRIANEIYHLDSTRRRVEFYWTYGAVEQDLGNYQVAIDWYKRCFVEPPPAPRVLNLEYFTWNPARRISECYLALKDYSNAKKWAQKVKSYLRGDIGTARWYQDNFMETPSKKEGYTLLTVEHGVKLRWESYTSEELFAECIDYLPFPDDCLDGFVLNADRPGDVLRVVKPSGFIWSVKPVFDHGVYCLGQAEYRNQKIYNYIKIDEDKPSFGFISSDRNFGPYRIRIESLIKSAAKKGYPVVDFSRDDTYCDVYVAQRLKAEDVFKASSLILDVCEKLPDYTGWGFEHAHAVSATSPLLVDHIKSLYPHLPVFHIADHFEMKNEGWL